MTTNSNLSGKLGRKLGGKMTLAAVTAAVLAAGCLTHMPADPRLIHLGVKWEKDYESLRSEAARTGKPMMICLIAGKIDGAC